ncbi:MAG: T9SS type A sorting domain-containing protein [Ignavibacteria bacterium]
MKNIKLLIFAGMITLLLSFVVESDNSLISSYKKINANNITTYFKNTGEFNNNFETGGPGFEWADGRYARLISRLVIGAVSGTDTLISIGGEFQPGYIDINGNTNGREDSAYRVYKIIKGDTTGSDYLNWPSGQGAYVRDNGKPFVIGDQSLFSAYTDGYSDAHMFNAPLKADILETDWAFDLYGPMGNAVFSEFRIINRSTSVWYDFYAGIYTDDQLDEENDDEVCNDSALNIGYTFNSDNISYGSAPPAVAFDVMSGMAEFTGNSEDSVVIYRPYTSNNRIVKRGYKNSYLSSFNPLLNMNPVIGDPINTREYYNLMSGLKKDGSIWINPSNNLPTRFPCVNLGGGDYRFMISSGPVTVYPGDTQTFIIGQVIARGANNLASIAALRSSAGLINNQFRSNFNTTFINDPPIINIPDNYELYQNFPNPFNPSTKIKFSVAVSGNINLTVYDINGKEVKVLANGFYEAGDKEVTFDGAGLPSGVYFYKLTIKNLSSTLKMILMK